MNHVLARWPMVVMTYFAMAALLRIAFGTSLELDEAEARYFAETLELGYGPQPPLYFWLQWAFFQLLGPGVAALATLKALILSALVLMTWGFLGPLGEKTAVVASMALGLMPEIVWENQRALTHTTLALCLSVALVWLGWRAMQRPGWGSGLALGLVMGLGQLAKSNFALVSLTLLVTLVLTAGSRLHWRGLAAGILLAVLVAMPVPVFAWLHPDLAFASVHKLGMGGRWIDAVAGLFPAFGAALLSLFALPLLVLGWPVAKSVRERRRIDPRIAFIMRFAVVGLCVALGLAMAAGVSEVRARWLLPLCWPVVVAGAAILPILAWRVGLFAALWLVALFALPLATVLGVGYRTTDFSDLSRQFREGEVVVSDTLWLAGNLQDLVGATAVRYSEAPFDVLGAPLS